MAIALRQGTNGNLSLFQVGESVQADSFERLDDSGNLIIGSTLGVSEELRLGSSTSAVSVLGDLVTSRVARYSSWPSLTPAGGEVDVEFDTYQAATVTLNAATVTITLNTPPGPGAFKILLQQDGTGGRDVVWDTEGSIDIYSPSGEILFSQDANALSLVGLIYDGSQWCAIGSPLELVT